MFNPFNFTVIADNIGFTSAILLFIFCMYYVLNSSLNRSSESAKSKNVGLSQVFPGLTYSSRYEHGLLRFLGICGSFLKLLVDISFFVFFLLKFFGHALVSPKW